MTASLVAVVTDVVKDGRRVVGMVSIRTARYGQGGLIRERFRDRILEADPASLMNDAGTNLDPPQDLGHDDAEREAGGHGERSVAVGTIDMAVWDAVAKIEDKPLFRLLAKTQGRRSQPEGLRLRCGWLLLSRKDDSRAAEGNARLSRSRLQCRQDEDRRRLDR